MFDWFWEWSVMRTLQGWVDATREVIDPIWLLIAVVGAALGVIAWMNAPDAVRDRAGMGQHYLGRITPKTLAGMLRGPRVNRARTREEVERAVRESRRRARQKAREEALAEADDEDDEAPGIQGRSDRM